MWRADIPAAELVVFGHQSKVGEDDLFWLSLGEDSDRNPVLFLHGMPTWSWLWRNVLPHTALLTRSVALDLPGFGKSSSSSGQDFQVITTAAKIEQFIDMNFGNSRPVSLVVHDFGALVGAELVARQPERYPNLVVTNTSMRFSSWSGAGLLSILGVPGLGQLSMWLARPWMLRRAMLPFVADSSVASGHRIDGYWYPFELGFGQTLARMFQQRPTTADDFDRWRASLAAYEGRTLILWGMRDPAFTSAELADIHQLLPLAETLCFEHASHFLPEERPKAVGRRIRSFLAREPV